MSAVGGWGRRLAAMVGVRRRVVVDGVRYAEVTGEPLDRALSRRGTGSKEYHVTFRDGSRMRVRATPRREFADLTGPRLLEALKPGEEALRPGMRVLVLRAGTGYVAAWAGERVGPSGAVVSLEPDEEAARFASRRYRAANISVESGWIEALRGEVDGAFDAVLAVEALWVGEDAVAAIKECWRLVGGDGWLVVGGASAAGPPPDSGPMTFTPATLSQLVGASVAGAPEAQSGNPATAPDQAAWVIAAIRRESR